jgi:hypothetical protein
MQPIEEQNLNLLPAGWSVKEELAIAMIQQNQLGSRSEVIRRMQRRKRVSPLAAAGTQMVRLVEIYWPPGEGYSPTGSFLAPCAAHQV